MHDQTEIERRIIAVTKEVLCIEGDDPALDAHIVNDLEASSLDQVSLFMALEDEFDETIADSELEHLATLRDVVHYVERHLQAEAAE